MPLQDIKVVDFTWVVAGPLLTRCMADFGATVVKVESHHYADVLRVTPPFKDGINGLNRSGPWANFNVNKYGASINLNHPKGLEVVKRLVAWADVVVENFSPGTMEQWHLTYDDLVKIKPDIIMVSVSIQGQSGPHAHHPGIATSGEALTGFHMLTGWSDRLPSLSQAYYGDVLTPILGMTAVLAAIDHKRRTGEGQWLDVNMLEAASYFFSPLLLDYLANGHEATRMGNRHPWASPHGVFPCRDEDRWCALSISTDAEWDGLRRAMGDPAWARGDRFATFVSRKEHEDELEELIGRWTRSFSPNELMALLQQHGVPAGAALTNAEVLDDPQLKFREACKFVEHPEIGRHGVDSLPFRLSSTPAQQRWPAPCLGEHTEFVCREILGMGEEEIISLLNEQVFD